ncbi:MAG: hypothetical protein MUO40_09260 [Anaerolineaceae bacterium]|nr:hypothetical protein [Anaerolineaceae bacterium]
MVENPNFVPEVKPGKVQVIAIMTLVSGILNVVYGLTLTVLVVLGTFGIGLLCFPLTIYPSVVGIFEIIAGAKLMRNPPQRVKVKTIAILEIVSVISLAFPAVVVGILNLVFYNEPEVKDYIDSLPA